MTAESAAPGEVSAGRESLQLVHHHPGRLRVRADVFRGDDNLAARVRDALLTLAGVTRFAHNARTGSLLVEYQPGVAEPDSVLARVADVAGIARYRADDGHLVPRSPALIAVDAAREVNAIAHELTGWRADLRVIVPSGLAALAAYSFVYHKDERLPRWDNLLYWSYNVFVSLHRREIEKAGALDGRSAAQPGQHLAESEAIVKPPS